LVDRRLNLGPRTIAGHQATETVLPYKHTVGTIIPTIVGTKKAFRNQQTGQASKQARVRCVG
jgi:hypothetical protein